MESGTEKIELVLVNKGTKLEKVVTVIDVGSYTGKFIQKRLVIEWTGAGQAHYTLNLATNTLHKSTTGPRLGIRAGLWGAKDLDLASKIWYELRKRKI